MFPWCWGKSRSWREVSCSAARRCHVALWGPDLCSALVWTDAIIWDGIVCQLLVFEQTVLVSHIFICKLVISFSLSFHIKFFPEVVAVFCFWVWVLVIGAAHFENPSSCSSIICTSLNIGCMSFKSLLWKIKYTSPTCQPIGRSGLWIKGGKKFHRHIFSYICI